jgi:hypothetical protein
MELVALAPEVILASGGSDVGPLLQVTRSVPVVFTQTPDPVAAGFVASLARPGGNATGFTDPPVAQRVSLYALRGQPALSLWIGYPEYADRFADCLFATGETAAWSVATRVRTSALQRSVLGSCVLRPCLDLLLQFVPSAPPPS